MGSCSHPSSGDMGWDGNHRATGLQAVDPQIGVWKRCQPGENDDKPLDLGRLFSEKPISVQKFSHCTHDIPCEVIQFGDISSPAMSSACSCAITREVPAASHGIVLFPGSGLMFPQVLITSMQPSFQVLNIMWMHILEHPCSSFFFLFLDPSLSLSVCNTYRYPNTPSTTAQAFRLVAYTDLSVWLPPKDSHFLPHCYVYIYICTYIYTYTLKHTYTHICMCMYSKFAYIHVFTYRAIHPHTHTHTNTHMHTHTHTYTYCAHTYTHTHTLL